LQHAQQDKKTGANTAKLEKDGTMTGTLSAGKHSAPWTAERLGR